MNTNYAPVISLIIVEAAAMSGNRFFDSGRVLVCVRDPATNVHHPNVLSVPTRRISADSFEAITKKCSRFPFGDTGTILEAEWSDSGPKQGHDELINTVESLLAHKLGIADGHRGSINGFRAKPVWIERGSAAYPKGCGDEVEYEPIDMLGILVLVPNIEVFPGQTGSYNRILSTPISQFLLSYEERDVQCVDPTLNAIELCIHGLCVATAYTYLSQNVVGRQTPTKLLPRAITH